MFGGVVATNFDGRSFSLDYEVNLNICDAAEKAEAFERSKTHSPFMKRSEFESPSEFYKMCEEVAVVTKIQTGGLPGAMSGCFFAMKS